MKVAMKHLVIMSLALIHPLNDVSQSASVVTPAQAPELPEERVIFSDGALIDEVLSSSQNPKIYDWRNSSWELELGLDSVDEGTVFSSQGWHIGAGFSLGGGWQVRTGLRRLYIKGSSAGNDLEKTPFRQPAQPTRYELYSLVGFSLMEGRISTRLSSWLSDFEHVLSIEGGPHYVHPSVTAWPTKVGTRGRVPGQSVAVSSWVVDLGLRYQIYLPSGVGLFVSSLAELPIGGIDGPAGQWIGWSGGVVFAFGGHAKAKK